MKKLLLPLILLSTSLFSQDNYYELYDTSTVNTYQYEYQAGQPSLKNADTLNYYNWDYFCSTSQVFISTTATNSALTTESATRASADTTLQANIDAIEVSTGADHSTILLLQAATAQLHLDDLAIGLTTATLQSNINATNVSTGALRNEIIVSTAELVAVDVAIKVSTGALRQEIITSTSELVAVDKLILTSTGVIQTQVNNIATSTGNMVTINTFQNITSSKQVNSLEIISENDTSNTSCVIEKAVGEYYGGINIKKNWMLGLTGDATLKLTDMQLNVSSINVSAIVWADGTIQVSSPSAGGSCVLDMSTITYVRDLSTVTFGGTSVTISTRTATIYCGSYATQGSTRTDCYFEFPVVSTITRISVEQIYRSTSTAGTNHINFAKDISGSYTAIYTSSNVPLTQNLQTKEYTLDTNWTRCFQKNERFVIVECFALTDGSSMPIYNIKVSYISENGY